MQLVKTLLAGAALGLAALGAAAQGFPDGKPITLHVPYPAGGPTDVLARTLAASMEKSLRTTIVVENTGGGGGTIGSAKVARANPDGYSILLNNLGMSTTPTLYRNLPYSPDAFAPVGQVATVPMVLLVRNSLDVKTLPELVNHIKANPDKVNMGHAGVGSAAHLCGLLLQSAIQTKVQTISYRGAAPAMTDLVSGQFDFMCEQVSSSLPFITGNRVRAIAVTSPQPLAVLPGVPTTASSGLGAVDVGVWHGIWAPRGTPAPVIDRLATALNDALRDPEVVKKLTELSAVPAAPADVKPESLRALVQSEMGRWAPIIRAAAEYAD
jgi:tripartite-type tricarboxylate transporter receptor subunit TctC